MALTTTELQASLNRLAGTSGLDAQAAANKWAGTQGMELLGALNFKNHTSGLGLNAVCQQLMSKRFVDAQEALWNDFTADLTPAVDDSVGALGVYGNLYTDAY